MALRQWWADAFVRLPGLRHRETEDGLIAESRVYHG